MLLVWSCGPRSCLYISVYILVSIGGDAYMSFYLSIHPSIYLSVYLSNYLSVYVPIYLPIYLTIYLEVLWVFATHFHQHVRLQLVASASALAIAQENIVMTKGPNKHNKEKQG